MSVGILIITHNNVGSALLNVATTTFGELPMPAMAVAINHDIDPQISLFKLRRLVNALDTGDGVLVLTDLFGSTPSNIARVLQKDHKVKIISGVNLPMLIRVMNYPTLNLTKLADKALTGGKEGVLNCAESLF